MKKYILRRHNIDILKQRLWWQTEQSSIEKNWKKNKQINPEMKQRRMHVMRACHWLRVRPAIIMLWFLANHKFVSAHQNVCCARPKSKTIQLAHVHRALDMFFTCYWMHSVERCSALESRQLADVGILNEPQHTQHHTHASYVHELFSNSLHTWLLFWDIARARYRGIMHQFPELLLRLLIRFFWFWRNKTPQPVYW